MNRKYIALVGLALSATLFSCGGSEAAENTDNTIDSTAVVEEPTEENTLAFDGVDKGAYTLYGHTDIAADGNETSLDEMNTMVESVGTFEGKVAVTISEVCQKAGCWITLENGDSDPIRVFFRDHFTIPIETAAGTEAIVYGIATQDTLTVDFQKHLLDDAAENGQEIDQSEYDAITEDKIEVTFDCEAILVKK